MGVSKITWKIMRVISKVDGQSLNVSAIKRPTGLVWFFVIHMAGWLMVPPKLRFLPLQKTAFAVVQ